LPPSPKIVQQKVTIIEVWVEAAY